MFTKNPYHSFISEVHAFQNIKFPYLVAWVG